MRTHGNLKSWNDDRGFGFITSSRTNEEIFVHISSFPKDGVRPQVGELISFLIQTDAKGKKRAVGVQRAKKSGPKNVNPSAGSRNVSRSNKKKGLSLQSIVACAVMASVMYLVYTKYQEFTDFQDAYDDVPSSVNRVQSEPLNTSDSRFRCDGRQHCSQMTSRAEAVFFIRNCPNTKMDGDHDGIPCENDTRF